MRIVVSIILGLLAIADVLLYLGCRKLEEKVDSIDEAVYVHMKDEMNYKAMMKESEDGSTSIYTD